jgi:hypothetical protein
MAEPLSTCGFCGKERGKFGSTCTWCGAPNDADPTRSLTEAIIGPIDRVFLVLPTINRATAMGVARHFDTIYTGPHGYYPDPGCILSGLALVVGLAGGIGWLIGGTVGILIASLMLIAGISLITLLAVRGIRSAEQVRIRLQNEQRLRDNGQLLRGEVVDMQQSSTSRSQLTYRFLTPDGRWLTHAMPIHPMPAPPNPGTPMAIMYVDDTCYKAL